MNHPLARALRGAGIDTIDIAARLCVDPKTVQRWLTGRVPYPRHREALAQLTGWSVWDLWPNAARRVDAQHDQAADEVIMIYPHRSAVPADVWHNLFEHAQTEIGILVYSGLSLAEDTATLRVLRQKARKGVRVRLLLGDPDGAHVARRGADENIGVMMSARIRNALVLYWPLADAPAAELRLHDTVLYNSIYRADDLLLVNTHAHGCPALARPGALLAMHRLAQHGGHIRRIVRSRVVRRPDIGQRSTTRLMAVGELSIARDFAAVPEVLIAPISGWSGDLFGYTPDTSDGG
ncbi:MAG TPA: XRE family transcriptional regulator [Micromonosporaceae bacterium]|nr:XRE family transcriptional regulator [Micromonosporaceae bacterium]